MSDRDVASAPTPVGAPTPGVETPTREITREPIEEPSRWSIAIEDAERAFYASRCPDDDSVRVDQVSATRSVAAGVIALNHLLHRLTQAIESAVVQLGEISCGVDAMVEVRPTDLAGLDDDDEAQRPS